VTENLIKQTGIDDYIRMTPSRTNVPTGSQLESPAVVLNLIENPSTKKMVLGICLVAAISDLATTSMDSHISRALVSHNAKFLFMRVFLVKKQLAAVCFVLVMEKEK
jgi:hypothetical protein